MDGRLIYFYDFSIELVTRMETLYERGEKTNSMQISLTDMWTISDQYFEDSYDFIDELNNGLQKLVCKFIRSLTLKRCKSIRDKAENFIHGK